MRRCVRAFHKTLATDVSLHLTVRMDLASRLVWLQRQRTRVCPAVMNQRNNNSAVYCIRVYQRRSRRQNHTNETNRLGDGLRIRNPEARRTASGGARAT